MVAFSIPIRVGSIFGVAFAADAAAGGDVDVAGGRGERMGTNWHEWGRGGCRVEGRSAFVRLRRDKGARGEFGALV